MKFIDRVTPNTQIRPGWGVCYNDWTRLESTVIARMPLNLIIRLAFASYLFLFRPFKSFDALFRNAQSWKELRHAHRRIHELTTDLHIAEAFAEGVRQELIQAKDEIEHLHAEVDRLEDARR